VGRGQLERHSDHISITFLHLANLKATIKRYEVYGCIIRDNMRSGL
jgi:hypothetical protein